MKRIYLFFALLIISSLLLAACGEVGAQTEKYQTDWQLTQYNRNQPVHKYTASWERWIVQTIYDFRITKLSPTWAVAVADGTGEPIDMCASKGYGIPFSTSITNPQQYYSGTTIGMMEPNGTYPGDSSFATWILCIEPDGSLHPWYVETATIVYDHPVQIALDQDRHMYRIIRAGTASEDTKIVLPTNFDPKIQEEDK